MLHATPPQPPQHYSPPRCTWGTLFSAMALNVDTGPKLWSAETSNIDVIPRYMAAPADCTAK